MPSWEKLQCSRKCYFFRFLHVCLCQNCLKYLENYTASLRFFNFSPMWQQRHIYILENLGNYCNIFDSFYPQEQYIWWLISKSKAKTTLVVKKESPSGPSGPALSRTWRERKSRPLQTETSWDIADREQARNCRVQLSRGSADRASGHLQPIADYPPIRSLLDL